MKKVVKLGNGTSGFGSGYLPEDKGWELRDLLTGENIQFTYRESYLSETFPQQGNLHIIIDEKDLEKVMELVDGLKLGNLAEVTDFKEGEGTGENLTCVID